MPTRSEPGRDLFALLRRCHQPAVRKRKRPLGAHSFETLEGRIAPAIVVTGSFSFTIDTDLDGKGDPGDQVHHVVTVQNTGPVDISGLSFADIINDPNLQLVPGSVNVSPVGLDDAFNAVGNTLLRVGGSAGTGPEVFVPGGSVLGNDLEYLGDASMQATPLTNFATPQGGVLNLFANGSFTYLPPVGKTGVTDSFTYTVHDSGIDGISGNADDLSSTATVNISLTGKVIYVDATAPAGGDGRSTSAYTSLSSISGPAGNDAVNDTIYVAPGTYAGGFTLLNGQVLHGANDALTITLPAGSPSGAYTIKTSAAAPLLTNTGGTVLTLATGNNLHGFTIGDSGTDISGSNFGTLTVNNVTLNGTGAPLALTSGTLAASFNSISTTSVTGSALSFTGVDGNFGVTGATTLSGASGNAFVVSGGAVNITLPSLTLSSITGAGLALSNHTGTFTVTSGAIGSVGGDDISVTGGTDLISIGANITNTAGHSIFVDNHETNNATFSGTISDTGTGIVVQNSNSGTIGFTGTAKTLNTGANSAVTLIGNTGGTINFTGGGLDIDTTTAVGFNASGGGTINVTGSLNSITSVSATALSVVNTGIGGIGFVFHDISAGNNTSATDPAVGILLTNTGPAGGLIVTGDGTNNASGGLIQNVTNSGILLSGTQNVSLTSIKVQNTSHYGISGTGVVNFAFINGTIDNSGTGGTAEDSNIGFNLPTTGTANISGALTVSGSLLTNSFYHGVTVRQDTGTISNLNISANTFTSSTVISNSNGSAIDIDPTGSASSQSSVTKGTINNNTITNFPSGAGIQILGGNTSRLGASQVVFIGTPNSPTDKLTIAGNAISGQNSANGLGTNAIAFQTNGFAQGNIEILNNGTAAAPLQFFKGNGILVGASGFSDVHAKIQNNVMDGSAEIAGSPAISIGTDSTFATSDTPHLTVSVLNNTVSNSDGNGILATARDATGTLDIRIDNNIIGAPRNGVRQGIRVDSGNVASANDTVHLEISGNTSAPSVGQTASLGIGLRKEGTATNVNAFSIEGLPPTGGGSSPAVENFVNSKNPAGGGTLLISATSGFTPFGTVPSPLLFIPDAEETGTTTPGSPSSGAGNVETPGAGSVVTVTTPEVPGTPSGGTADVSTPDHGLLTQSQLDALVSAAKTRWMAAGLTAAQIALLDSVSFTVENLPGWYLGETSRGHVTLDADAAGNGWFVDATPLDDSEFTNTNGQLSATPAGGAAGHLDALTTVMHELGHVLGLEDSYASADANSLMYGFLHTGERRVAAFHQADGALPHSDAGIDFQFAPMALGNPIPAGKTITIVYDQTVKSATARQATSQIQLTDVNGALAGTSNVMTVPLDPPDVSIAVDTATVVEDGATFLTYTFTRTGPVTSALPVNFTLGGTATASDYTLSVIAGGTLAPGTITFNPGASQVTVKMSPNDDTIVESNETVSLTLAANTSTTSDYDIVVPSSATGTITNDDSATLTLSGGVAKSEGASGTVAYTFTATLSNAVEGGFTVPYTTNDGTATVVDNDYTDNDGTLTFTGTAGETKTITVLVNGDNKVELNETFNVALGPVTGSTATQLAAITPSGSPQTATITNDDSATVSISGNLSQAEGTGNFVYTVTLSNPVDAPVTVSFSTSDGTATTADSDYTGISNQIVTFPAGSVAGQTVSVVVPNDNKVEANEVFNVALSGLGASGRNVVLGTATATGTILNDDSAIVTITGGGSAPEGNTGNSAHLFTVTLNNAVQGGFSLPFTTNDGTATVANNDYQDNDGTLVFTGTAGETKTITVNIVGDTTVESDETFTVALGSLVGAPAGVTVAGSPQTGTIVNDDSQITVAVSPSSIAEDAAGLLTYTFTRTGFLGNSLAVDFAISGLATQNIDYTVAGATFAGAIGTVTFAPNSATATVTVDPTADTIGESNESVIFTINPGAGYTAGAINTATGTIIDDDTTVSVAIGATTSVGESSGTGLIYTFTRTGDTSAALPVNFSVGGSSTFTNDYTAAAGTGFTFGAGTGSVTIPAGITSATVILTPVNDASVEGSETAILTLATGAGYGITGSPASGTIIDNDTATIGFANATSNIGEGAGNDGLGLVLTLITNGTGAPTLERDVTFNVTTAAGGTAIGGGTDYTLPALVTFAAGSLNGAVKTANLAIFNDALVEGSETANLGLTLGTDNTGGQVSITTGASASHVTTIVDNDTATIGFATATSSALESASNDPLGLVLTINANGTGPAALARAVTFNVAAATGGTATAGTDYALPPLLTFAAGALNNDSVTANLGIVDDATVEGTETVNLGLAVATDSTGGQISIAVGSPATHVTSISDNDTATFEYVNATSSVGEAAGTNPLAVKLTINAIGTGTPTLARDVTLNVTTSGGTALGGGADYTLPSLVTFSAGALNGATQTANLTLINDTLIEGPETATLGLAIATDGTGGRAAIGVLNSHTATINDNDTATISFATATSTAPEGTTPHSFDVRLITNANGVAGAGTLAGDVTVAVSAVTGAGAGTATAGGVDFTFPAAFNVTFPSGSTDSSKPVTVAITNDQVSEGDETINFALASFANNVGSSLIVASAPHTTTIVDNDIDLRVTASGPVSAAIAGSGSNNLSFTITLSNPGNVDATNITLSDLFTLPAGVTLTTSTPSAGVFTGNDSTGTWTIPALAKNASVTLTIGFTADHSAANNSVANLGATIVSASETLVNTSDDSANASGIINRQGDLSVTLSDTPDPVGPGQPLTYTIVVSNNGPSDSTGANVNDLFPAGLSNVSWTAAFTNGGSGNLSGTGNINESVNISAGGSVTYTATGVVAAGAANSTLTDIAAVSAPRAQDSNPGNDSSSASTTISGIDLQITSDDGVTTAHPGDLLKYTLTYQNGGFVTSTGVKITDLVPVNTVFDAANSTAGWTGVVDGSAAGTTATFDAGSLPVGANPANVVFAVRVTGTVAAGEIAVSNSATISDDGTHGADGNRLNDVSTDTDALVAAPDLHLQQDVQTDGGIVARRGGSVAYTLHYSNEGNQDATGVFITETLPANTRFNQFGSTSGWTETTTGSGVFTFPVGKLTAGDGLHAVTFAVVVDSTLPNHTSQLSTTATIDDGGKNGADPNPDDNTKTETTPVYQGIYAVSPGITVPKGFGPPTVLVFDAATGLQTASFLAYESNIKSSIRITVADMNGDGFDDIITSSARGTGRIRVFLADSFTGTSFTESGDEIAAFDGRKERGGFIAAGDVDGDGTPDIVVGSALGGGRLKVYDGFNHSELLNLLPFGAKFRGGIRVATGDVNGDGVADIIAGQGFHGGRVKVYSGVQDDESNVKLGGTVLLDFQVGGSGYRGGISVAAADLNGDGRADIVTGRNASPKPLLQVFSGADQSLLKSFLALPGSFHNGIRVAAADVNLDGIADIIVGAGFDGGSQVKIFDGQTNEVVSQFVAFPSFPQIALWVAGSAKVPLERLD